MKIKIFKWILLIIISNSFILGQGQLNEMNALKALCCTNIVTQKFAEDGEKPSAYSPYVLVCFMKISEEQVHDLLSNLEEGKNSLTKEDILELIDMNSLNNFSEEEIKRKSEELESIMEELQKLDENYSKENELNDNNYDDEYYDDEDYNYDSNNTYKFSIKNIFGLIKKGMKGFFNEAYSIWYAFLILVILYISLKIIRKFSDSENNKNIKNSTENKKENGKINKNNEKEEIAQKEKEEKEQKEKKGKEKKEKED